ncbi:hypothetical protein KW516_18750 [Vibrio fluvialis]|nr:hypothetical protein [Vibrio fluvialis]
MIINVEFGLAKCTFEPRGENGLEGYQCGCSYAYRKMKNTSKGTFYYRVFPVSGSDYYETCSSNTFGKFFEKESVN